MTDQAVNTPIDDDLFDSATTDWITPADLDGRLLLFIPRESGTAKGAQGNYDFVVGDMLVLDGAPTEKIPGPFPFEVVGQRISAGMATKQLKPRVKTQKMVLGRMNSRPGQFNNPAYSLGDPTDADKAVARQYAQRWLDKLTAAAAANDPFAA